MPVSSVIPVDHFILHLPWLQDAKSCSFALVDNHLSNLLSNYSLLPLFEIFVDHSRGLTVVGKNQQGDNLRSRRCLSLQNEHEVMF